MSSEDSVVNISLLVLSAIVIMIVLLLGTLLIWRTPSLCAVTLGNADAKAKRIAVLAAALVSLSCMLPMGLSPLYNGEVPDHRNQYELITEAFLSGHLDFQYDYIDPRLLEMENPYDAQAREEQGVYAYWDHAFYDGHYYMYFGVAPVLLAFLPYRVLTGQALTGYHVTQLYTALHIGGLFLLLWLVGRRHFKKMPLSLYLLICSAVSYISVWNAVATPALYGMAIICALGLASMSLCCFAGAVWYVKSENRAIALAALGSLLGALEFGCRPTVGLSNIVVLALLVDFIKQRGISAKRCFKLALAALPYVLVAAGLMGYNAARFDNPFEFGQSYQMTVTDQSSYGNMLARFDPLAIARGLYYYLLNVNTPSILPSLGLFVAFPLLLVSFALLAGRKTRAAVKRNGLSLLLGCVLASILVIMVFELLWAPHPTPRYRMDFAWLMGLAAFILIGSASAKDEARFCRVAGALCLLALAVSVVLALYPQSGNFTEYFAADIKAMLGLQ